MPKELIIVIIAIVASLQFICSVAMLVQMCRGDGFTLSPVAIKDYLELTWFGAVVMFTISLILFIWVYVICFIHFLFKGKWPEEFE